MTRPRHLRESQRDPRINANRIGQRRTEHRHRYKTPGACLIVEGPLDVKLHSRFIDMAACFILFAGGKDKAIETSRITKHRGIPGILTIVDCDYDHLLGYLPYEDNIIETDAHDLETTILKSPALEGILSELMPPGKLVYRDQLAIDIRKHLIEIGLPLGCLRYICLQQGISWNKDLTVERQIDSESLVLNLSTFAEDVSRAPGAPDSRTIIRRVKELASEIQEPWRMCNGHDLIHILRFILPILLKKYTHQSNIQIPTNLPDLLRACYEYRYFEKTNMYSRAAVWEENNPPYTIYTRQ